MGGLASHDCSFSFLDVVKFPGSLIAAGNERTLVGSEVQTVDLIFVVVVCTKSKLLGD